jgi:predicted dehydrogenase
MAKDLSLNCNISGDVPRPAGSAFSRRTFLKRSGLALAAGALFPALAPARALGRDGNVAPSIRITLGVVGGHQGWSDFQGFFGFKDVQPVAVCDVDRNTLASRANATQQRKGGSIARYTDFREMFDKANLDAVVSAPPDHWHAIVAIAAARKGIHIYGEKPLAHTIAEGRAIVNAVKQHGVVWQTGSFQRSAANFFRAVELVRNGILGKVNRVEVGTLATQNGFGSSLKTVPDTSRIGKPPAHIDYDMWVGPAAWMDFDPRFITYHWRWILNFGGGNLMDWVGHHVDIAHWGMGFDTTGPQTVTPDLARSNFSRKIPWDAETDYDYKCTYANGKVIHVASHFAAGAKFFGENGKWVYVNRGRLSSSNNAEILNAANDPTVPAIYYDKNHTRNFVDSIKAGKVEGTTTPAETAHRSASVGHLGHIAITVGRTIKWDPVTERIKDDKAASALLSPSYRSPWVL